jgi:site-specific DNA-methyltransferase (adenine-specific)
MTHQGKGLPVNQILHGDNVVLLREQVPDSSIDLIYADPPFNSGKPYFATGKQHEGPRFHDTWRWDTAAYQHALAQTDDRLVNALEALRSVIGEGDALAFCAALAPCLSQLRRALKPTGSLYLHGDPKMGAYLRLMLDALMGRAHFRNEIVWAYRTGGAGKRHFARKHDVILFYTASATYTFHPQKERIRYRKRFFDAQRDDEGYYADVLLRDVWEIPAVINVSSERTGYPTQKPLALLERIVAASSNAGDVVLDPFCGSGTTLLAAQTLGRRYIGIDVNDEAVRMSKERLEIGELRLRS